jgi:uncharacterized protein (DUF362 family)
MSRRQFLRSAAAAAAGVLAAGCQQESLPGWMELTPAASTPAAEATPAAETTPAAKTSPVAQVAIAHATTYDRALIREQVRNVLDGIGGLGDVIQSGDRVAIKVNLTGGTSVAPLDGVLAIESYITHPEVVRALGEFVRDAGARELFLVEAVYEWDSYRQWGYEAVAADLDATPIDLNDTLPYSDYATTPVGDDWYIYPEFTFNHILEEVDVFISVPKMKCHWSAGVTHSLKNLVGLVPARFYQTDPRHNHRSGFHGTEQEMGTRLPRVIVDLNRARPIDLALIDGIKTVDGGEGPWNGTLSPVEPGLLFAGKDPVATDAVATAAMEFDPTEVRSHAPFLRSDNHLNIAHERGLGTNLLDEIEVVGPAVADVRIKFEPSGK